MIDDNNGLTKRQCLKLAGVSKTAYYNWLNNKEKIKAELEKKQHADDDIMEKMREIIKLLCFIPGKRTFKTHLWRSYDINISVKRAKKLMNKMHLIPTPKKKSAYLGQATHFHECACALNYVNQDFKIGPRRVILTDITYLFYNKEQRRCYLCVFKDAFTNEILGYAVSTRMKVDLVKAAYNDMMKKHGNEIDTKKSSVYIHHDQGSQLLETSWKKILHDDGFIQSTSFRGNSQDNAPCESFFSRFKNTLLDILARSLEMKTVRELIAGYIDNYNNDRYQLPLAGLTPHEFYLYSMTGIYPLDNYFGVKSSKMISVEDIVKEKLNKQAEISAKRKAAHNKQRLERSSIHDPKRILVRDKYVIEKERDKWDKVLFLAINQCCFLDELLERIKNATKFYDKLPTILQGYFTKPSNWQRETHMSYVLDMAALF